MQEVTPPLEPEVVNLLTAEQLQAMPPGKFARGETTGDFYSQQFGRPGAHLKWVATRGTGPFGDWAIYCHYATWGDESILRMGNKIHADATIRAFVPCTDDAFDLYRH